MNTKSFEKNLNYNFKSIYLFFKIFVKENLD